MTTSDLIKYYANLLILQYKGQPKAFAQVKATILPLVMDQLPAAVQDAYNIDKAVGVQLDVLGKYVGITRNGAGLTGQPISLDDDDFRSLIKMVIIKNNSGSSLATIQNLLATNFPGQVNVSDNQTMALSYILTNTLGTSDLLEMLVTGGFLPAPMGVAVATTIVPEHANPFFGFRTYEAPDPTVAPFNTYEFYQLTYPWLTYEGVS